MRRVIGVSAATLPALTRIDPDAERLPIPLEPRLIPLSTELRSALPAVCSRCDDEHLLPDAQSVEPLENQPLALEVDAGRRLVHDQNGAYASSEACRPGEPSGVEGVPHHAVIPSEARDLLNGFRNRSSRSLVASLLG